MELPKTLASKPGLQSQRPTFHAFAPHQRESDEGLMLEASTFKSLNSGHVTLHVLTHFIKQIFCAPLLHGQSTTVSLFI